MIFNLKKAPYYSIKEGIKKEEYREIKPYWIKRFCLYNGKDMKLTWWENYLKNKKDPVDFILEKIDQGVITFKTLDNLFFRMGYSKRGEITKRFNSIEVKKPDPKFTFGIMEEKVCFSIKFDNIIYVAYTSPINPICEKLQLLEEFDVYYKVRTPGTSNGVLVLKNYCEIIEEPLH